MRYQHIAIEGNIGAGKTTLARILAERYDAELLLESFDANPFLPKFYEAPGRYAFPVELFFLAERYHQLSRAAEQGHDLFHPLTISDHFIEKSLIFAWNNLEGEELQLFRRLFDIMYERLPKPDLILYLHKSPEKLIENIGSRGRSYEQGIESDYLKDLDASYFSFFKQQEHMKVVVVESDGLDFLEREADVRFIEDILDEDFSNGLHSVTRNGAESTFSKK